MLVALFFCFSPIVGVDVLADDFLLLVKLLLVFVFVVLVVNLEQLVLHFLLVAVGIDPFEGGLELRLHHLVLVGCLLVREDRSTIIIIIIGVDGEIVGLRAFLRKRGVEFDGVEDQGVEDNVRDLDFDFGFLVVVVDPQFLALVDLPPRGI